MTDRRARKTRLITRNRPDGLRWSRDWQEQLRDRVPAAQGRWLRLPLAAANRGVIKAKRGKR